MSRFKFRRTAISIHTACTGRPHILDSLDASFLEACIEWQPDILLKELQDQLCELCGAEDSISMIRRTLCRRGFTRKQITWPAIEHDEDGRAASKMRIGEHFLP
ncbi:hypothetical protein BD779DRAFT_203473 [Infundibulicybe gibba]|nr:hypothetical protein BD779DRAFT_203473 [Infundibulicybe gibba]